MTPQHDIPTGLNPHADASCARAFDGVICFAGEDWWYHNRGHYDIRIMRELARGLPVLFVNSIGMRTPRARKGGMFARRITRKLRSISHGRTTVDENFHVVSPFVLPGPTGMRLTGPMLQYQIRRHARALGMHRPLVWITVPTAAEVLRDIPHVGLVYQRTDRYESFPDVSRERIERDDAWLKAHADVTVFCASHLHGSERNQCQCAVLIDHGLDEERFLSADAAAEPDDLREIPRPRVGFVGGIDSHTFDPNLFCNVVNTLPDVQFILVGSCSLPAHWCDAPNVHHLGQRSYDDVHAYMAACDVLIMPWRTGSWIQACNPVKLKEYLAVGRPVVSTPFPELRRYDALVSSARSADDFADAIRQALADPGDASRRQSAVHGQSWPTKAQTILNTLADRGLRPETPFRLAEPSEPPVILTVPCSSTPRERTEARPERPTPRAHGVPNVCILLDGGLQPSPLVVQCGSSLLDLHVTRSMTLLEYWRHQLDAISATMNLRVVHGVHGPPPWPPRNADAKVTIEREPQPFRGPAGVVADVCRELSAPSSVLIAEASRLPITDIGALIRDHAAHDAALTIGRNPDGSPAGIYVARVDALMDVPDRGYIDLKEQWIANLLEHGATVRTHGLAGQGLVSIRTRTDLLRAVRRIAHDSPSQASPEDGSLICPTADVARDAVVRDSIIMPGARVESGALIVRSVITQRAEVKTGSNIADAVVSAGRCLSDPAANASLSRELP
ncbi:MAG: glycosyltransferase [Planctomycetota bacterium]